MLHLIKTVNFLQIAETATNLGDLLMTGRFFNHAQKIPKKVEQYTTTKNNRPAAKYASALITTGRGDLIGVKDY